MGDRTMTIGFIPGFLAPSIRFVRIATLGVIASAFLFAAGAPFNTAEAQARRAGRLQKRLDQLKEQNRIKKLNADENTPDGSLPNAEATPPGAAKNNARNPRNRVEGIRQRGLRSLFLPEERELIIPGFGNQATLLIVFRQLDLSPEQRQEIKAISGRIGNRLAILQTEHRMYDAQLTEAIYGENFDPKKVDEISAQVADRQSQIIKLRASIESQLRQVMTDDQFYVFHWLIGEMVIPQRRIPPAQLRQMMQRRAAPNQ